MNTIDSGGTKKLVVEPSDEADRKIVQEFAKLKKAKGTTDEEKMYMNYVTRQGS